MSNKPHHYDSLRIGTERIRAATTAEVLNPYTGGVAGRVPMASLEQVRRAIETARAFKSPLTRYDRYQICYRAAELIRARTAEISDLITAQRAGLEPHVQPFARRDAGSTGARLWGRVP